MLSNLKLVLLAAAVAFMAVSEVAATPEPAPAPAPVPTICINCPDRRALPAGVLEGVLRARPQVDLGREWEDADGGDIGASVVDEDIESGIMRCGAAWVPN
ncbi:hypothetical protein C8R44DRAFT_726593 [Mycena epipterygia]|nr:hypothetical protein C8R44DRAFT_726593 [Mycena epipterygia]